MQTDFLSPITLASNLFTIGADGSAAAPDPTSLINPNRTAMLVDSFNFNIGVGAAGVGVDFTSVMAKLSLGSTPLTNEFIPLRSFAPVYYNFLDDKTITWHLAKPMYAPPDVQLNIEFRRKVPFSGWAGTIDLTNYWCVSINGRSMPAGMAVPDKIYVPWACATTVYSTTVPYVSNDADIANPFDEPLNVDYFTGFNQTSSLAGKICPTPITFQATLSNGKVLARDPIPFFALFPPDRPMLRTRALLQPKEFVSVVLDLPQPTADYTNLIFTTVGMTGWRELQTPLGALP